MNFCMHQFLFFIVFVSWRPEKIIPNINSLHFILLLRCPFLIFDQIFQETTNFFFSLD